MPIEVIDPQGQLAQLDVPMVKRSPRKDGTVSLLGKGEDDGSDEAPPTAPVDGNGDGSEAPRATFTKDPATGDLIFSDGTRVRVQGGGAVDDDTADGRASLSFARARMEARRKAKEEAGLKPIEAVDVLGEEWFVRRLAGSETTAIPFYIERPDGTLIDLQDIDPEDKEDRNAVYAAIIYGTTVSGADDMAPAFASVSEVWEQFDESGDGDFVLALIGQILTVNKNLLKNLTGG